MLISILVILLYVIFPQPGNTHQVTAKLKRSVSFVPVNRIVLPDVLADCFVGLENHFDHEAIQDIMQTPEKDLDRFDGTVGMYIRKQWNLRNGSPVSRFFIEHGVRDASQMSSLILTSYWRYLHGNPVALDKQLDHLRDETTWNDQRVETETRQAMLPKVFAVVLILMGAMLGYFSLSYLK